MYTITMWKCHRFMNGKMVISVARIPGQQGSGPGAWKMPGQKSTRLTAPLSPRLQSISRVQKKFWKILNKLTFDSICGQLFAGCHFLLFADGIYHTLIVPPINHRRT